MFAPFLSLLTDSWQEGARSHPARNCGITGRENGESRWADGDQVTGGCNTAALFFFFGYVFTCADTSCTLYCMQKALGKHSRVFFNWRPKGRNY